MAEIVMTVAEGMAMTAAADDRDDSGGDTGLSAVFLRSGLYCKGNLTNLRRELHLSLAKGNPK
jgi:hypothetical protein